jgi:hypothetical protein
VDLILINEHTLHNIKYAYNIMLNDTMLTF